LRECLVAFNLKPAVQRLEYGGKLLI